jgi:hypothetical protein
VAAQSRPGRCRFIQERVLRKSFEQEETEGTEDYFRSFLRALRELLLKTFEQKVTARLSRNQGADERYHENAKVRKTYDWSHQHDRASKLSFRAFALSRFRDPSSVSVIMQSLDVIRVVSFPTKNLLAMQRF